MYGTVTVSHLTLYRQRQPGLPGGRGLGRQDGLQPGEGTPLTCLYSASLHRPVPGDLLRPVRVPGHVPLRLHYR